MKKGFTLSQTEAGRKNEVKQKMKMEDRLENNFCLELFFHGSCYVKINGS